MMKTNVLRTILLVLAILTTPLCCCSLTVALDSLPPDMTPSGLDFFLNLFEAEATVTNHTAEIIYLTPITTTYGYPRVIGQSGTLRQHSHPLHPGDTLTLTYDSADFPLSGIVVCREGAECRLLPKEYPDQYTLTSFADLSTVDPDWLDAVQNHPTYSYAIFFLFALSLIPIFLFAVWLLLSLANKRTAAAAMPNGDQK